MKTTRVSKFALWNAPVLENLNLVKDWRDLTVLEIGCGLGLLADHIAGLGAHVYTIDIAKPQRSPASRFSVGDTEAMPFASETFDVILSCSSLQYVHHARATCEINRVLKKGGWLLLHENGKYNPVIVLGRLWRHLRARHDAKIQRYVDSIYGYITADILLRNGALRLVNFKPHYLFGPVHQIIGKWRSAAGQFVGRQLMRIDRQLLRSVKPLMGLGWFNCYILRKNGEDASSIDLFASPRDTQSGQLYSKPTRQDVQNAAPVSIGESIARFKRGLGFRHLWHAARELRRSGRILETGYGLYCFGSSRPSQKAQISSALVDEMLSNTLHQLNRVSFDLRKHIFSRTTIRNPKIPWSFPVRRASCVDMGDRIIAGEYAEESGARIISVTRRALFISGHYERETGVKHIHLVHPLSEKMFFVATGDSRKALDLWEISGDSVFFRRRLMSHFAGFTAACTVNEHAYFGTDFAQRPNYIFCLDRKRTYFLPRPLFTMWVSDMLPYENRYHLGTCCTLSSYGGSGVFLFDTRDEKFVFADYLLPRRSSEPFPDQSKCLNYEYKKYCDRPKLVTTIWFLWLAGIVPAIPLPML